MRECPTSRQPTNLMHPRSLPHKNYTHYFRQFRTNCQWTAPPHCAQAHQLGQVAPTHRHLHLSTRCGQERLAPCVRLAREHCIRCYTCQILLERKMPQDGKLKTASNISCPFPCTDRPIHAVRHFSKAYIAHALRKPARIGTDAMEGMDNKAHPHCN